MMRIVELPSSEYAAWDQWLTQVPGANTRQTSLYRLALEAFGHSSAILVVKENSEFRAGALLAISRKLFRRRIRTSGGIALMDRGDDSACRLLLSAIVERARDIRASQVVSSLRLPLDATTEQYGRIHDSQGFSRLESPTGTYMLDIMAADDEALLAGFPKSFRRDVRKARKEGLVVRSGSMADVRGFCSAFRAMAERKGLSALPKSFETLVLPSMIEAGTLNAFVAEWNGRAVNYAVIDSVNQPIYHWGATTSDVFAGGCPPTGELLHFEAIRHYRNAGKNLYDLGGAPGAIPSAPHPNIGVWRFKHGFGGRYVQFVGPWTLSFGILPTIWAGFTRNKRTA